MNESLQMLCERFIANRDALRKVAPLDSAYIYPAAANTLTAAGVTADITRLKEVKKILEKNVSWFSYLRGMTELPLLAALYLSDDPGAFCTKANTIYKTLKTQFDGSEYLAMLAIFLCGLTDEAGAERVAVRGKALYKKMDKEHPFLTADHDSIMAGFMAFSEKTDDALIAECEECFRLLKQSYSDGQAVQTCSHILSIAEGTPAEKVNRLNALLKAVEADGHKYSRNEGLSVLAALSVNRAEVSVLAGTILELDARFAEQKGYGLVYCDKKTRLMYAAMLTATHYNGQNAADVAAPVAAMVAAIAQEAATCAMLVYMAACS